MNKDTTYQSHFAVYAVILNDAKDKVLLIKKALGCYTGLYDLPGGTMEPHELLEDTLKREVFEETACTVTAHKQIGAFSTLYPFMRDGMHTTLRHLAAIYTADITGTPRETSDGTDDSGGCVWLPITEVTHANAAPLVLDALERHLSS